MSKGKTHRKINPIMYNFVVYFKVTFILYITLVPESKVAAGLYFPISSRNQKRNDFKSIDANKIDIILKLRHKPKPNNAVDPNSLENFVPPHNEMVTTCEETTVSTPTVCEEVTTIPMTINCQSQEVFVCTKEGTFVDPDNRDGFFICHRKSRSDPTLEIVKMTCPKGTAFDQDVNKCTKRARMQCLEET